MKLEDKLFYRGHTDSTHVAQPSVFRNEGHRRHERDLLYSIISESPSEFDSDKYTFDRLVRAQHYGIKTRLLDLTTNPLMGLYFSCEDKFDRRGQVLVYEAEDAVKFFLSDTVSCKSNLVHLSEEERSAVFDEMLLSVAAVRKRTGIEGGLPTLKSREPEEYERMIDEFNGQPMVRKLVQFIKEEKPYFQNKIDPIDLIKVEAVYPKKSNPRILA